MTSRRVGRGMILAAFGSAALLLAGCMTETTFRPATGQGFDRTGYSESQVEPNRWLVTFAGNEVTPRDTVERYLLYRAAQLTLQHGNTYFVMVDRDTNRQTRTYSTGLSGGFDGFGPGFGYWGPHWSYYGRGFGWRSWDPFYGDPFFANDIDIRTVDRVEADAQIVMYSGPVPKNNPRVFDAHAVTQTLGPSIVLPKSN